MKYITFIILILIISFSSNANLVYKIQGSIQSTELEGERNYTVYLPKSYYNQQKYDYPVMYLLDGEQNLSYSQTVSNFLAESGVIPEMIIIAIHAGASREVDYLPMNPQTGSHVQGAAQFFKFIKNELMPSIHREYRAARLEMLSGHSYGGLFATYAMLKEPSLFDAYFTQSPYFNQTMGNEIYKDFKGFVKQKLTKPVFYYFNLGDEPELKVIHKKISRLLTDKSPKQFTWFNEIDDNKSHMTTRLTGQYAALEQFFVKDWPIANEQLIMGKIKGLNKHIETLSSKYEYPVLLNEMVFSTAIQLFLSSQDITSGIAASELYKKYYGQSVLAYFLSANAYGAKGDREQALIDVNTGIKHYENNPEADTKPYFKQLQQMKQALNPQ